MKSKWKLIFLLFIGGNLFAQSSFDEQQTSVSNVRMTVSNIGTFGNAMRGSFDLKDFSSAEYPANSGIEHLFESGIWIGGKINGSQVAVSTAAYDQSSGYSTGKAGYEMTAKIGEAMRVRSTLFDDPNFSTDAVSHQDFVSDFSDKNILVPGTNIEIERHDNPMGIDVHLETYNWNYSFSDFMVICNYTVTNTGDNDLSEVYLAMWANEVVRNINITPPGQGGSEFYNKGGNGFIDSLSMAYCFDAAGDLGFTESYIGHLFLGAEDKSGFRHPSLDSSFKTNYQCWQFNSVGQPVFFFPQNELERYEKMRNGLNHYPCWNLTEQADPGCDLFQSKTIEETIEQAGNRSDLVSVGPFESLNPGESIQFAWAWVFAKKNEDGNPNVENTPSQQANLVENAEWAQTAYNGEDVNFNGKLDDGEDADGNGTITRFILPTPPDIPKMRVEARDGGLDVYWSENAEKSVDPISQLQDFEGYRLFMTKVGFDIDGTIDLANDLKLIAEYDLKGNGLFFETGLTATLLEEPIQFDDDSNTYHHRYRIDNLLNGWQYYVALAAFDSGDEENNLESLESSKLSNAFAVFPGNKPSQAFEEYASESKLLRGLIDADLRDSIDQNRPFAYPNPYYSGASWEGASSFVEDGKITFSNLPKECVIRIFTTGGDLIKTIEHNQEYDGSETRWYQTYSNPEETVFSGGEHSWNLLSDNDQIIARGNYIFSVEDVKTSHQWKSSFTIIR